MMVTPTVMIDFLVRNRNCDSFYHMKNCYVFVVSDLTTKCQAITVKECAFAYYK